MAVVATGFFDGVHLGHREVARRLVSAARERGEEAVAVTFSQHPRAVFQRDARALRLLTSAEEKRRMLLSLGVDRVEILPFTPEFSALTARDYIDSVLVGRFGATAVALGYDNRFGSDGLSTSALEGLVRQMGLGCEVVPPLSVELPGGGGRATVSSTKIRVLLAEGRVDAAEAMLGYAYPLTGVVVPGKQLGRTIGFPTANLGLKEPLMQLPSRGVYQTRTTVLGEEYPSMTNVGDIVETHLFGFDRDIYSLEITVRFIRRIRDMRSFAGVGQLREQLLKDAAECLGS